MTETCNKETYQDLLHLSEITNYESSFTSVTASLHMKESPSFYPTTILYDSIDQTVESWMQPSAQILLD